MSINVSVQYNGGLLPDIILLTQCYYHRGTSSARGEGALPDFLVLVFSLLSRPRAVLATV